MKRKPDSSAAGEAHAEVEELIDIWLRLRVFICPHETDNGLMCAECGDEQSKLANELESISAAIDARRRRGEVGASGYGICSCGAPKLANGKCVDCSVGI